MAMCLRRTDDSDVAMSIVNDGFLRVFKKIHLYSFKGSLEGWVRRLVWHSLADHFRGNSKTLRFMGLEDRDAPTNGHIAQNLHLEDLLKMVDELPPTTREVFQLYAIQGYNHREIGERLGMSDGTSKWHLATARKKLQQMIEVQEKRNYAG